MDKLEKASAELKQASLPYRAQTRNSSLEKLSFFSSFGTGRTLFLQTSILNR